MQSLSIIGHPGGRHNSARQLVLTHSSIEAIHCQDLDNKQNLQNALASADHSLLVYCPPGLALARALEEDNDADCNLLLQSWSNQARNLLRHFMLNRERSTLVNELTLLYAPNTVLATLGSKTGHPITTNAIADDAQPLQPLLEVLGATLACNDQPSNSLYRDLETVADASGAIALQQYQKNLRKALLQTATEHSQLSASADKYCENGSKLQELQEENKALLQKQQQTQEALEQSLRERQKLSEKINTPLQSPERTESTELTEKSKELQEENELLLLQLHQVQEELEHYFCEYQKLTDPSKSQPVGRPQLSAPTAGLALETLFDLRDEQIIGNNWYDAECDGRWAGPSTHSTLTLPTPGEGPFELVFDIVHALDASIVKHMQILLNGEPLSLKHKFGKLPIKRFPCQVTAQVPQSNSAQPSTWQIEFRFPKTLSPAEKGDDDHRQLAMRLKSIRARALVTPHKG